MAKRKKRPTQEELFHPILTICMKYPAGNLTKVWYAELKAFFPHLTKKDFEAVTGKNKENEWQLQIRFSKKKLEYDYKYMVANLPHGFWRISNAGAKAWREMEAGTWVPPESRKKIMQR